MYRTGQSRTAEVRIPTQKTYIQHRKDRIKNLTRHMTNNLLEKLALTLLLLHCHSGLLPSLNPLYFLNRYLYGDFVVESLVSIYLGIAGQVEQI